MVQYHLVQRRAAYPNLEWVNRVWHNLAWISMVLWNLVQFGSLEQFNVAWCSLAHYSPG